MFIAALFCRIRIPLNRDRLFRNLLLINSVEMHMVRTQTDNLLILNKINLSRVFQNRRHIRCNKAPILVLTDNQRTVLADRKHLVRMVCKQNAQRIGTLHTMHNLCNRLERIPLIIIVNQVRQNFRVGVRCKLVPF